MLMQLGNFVFKNTTLSPQSLSKSITANWPKQARYAGRPALQFTGIDTETLEIAGVIYPFSDITGTAKDLDEINDMVTGGEKHILVTSAGDVLGQFGVTGLNETHTLLDKEGKSEKIEFTINLVRTDDERIDKLL